MQWLAEYTAWQMNMLRMDSDGKTPYAKVRGKDPSKRLVRFGERVLFKKPPTGPRSKDHKLEGRWEYGYVVGYGVMTNDYRVIKEASLEVTSARSIQRVPEEDRWRGETLEKVQVTPQSERQPEEVPVDFERREECGCRCRCRMLGKHGAGGRGEELEMFLFETFFQQKNNLSN